MNGHRLRLLNFCICVGVLVFAAVYVRRRSLPASPQGSFLKLAGVTYGTNAFIYGNFLQRMVHKQIPYSRLPLFGYKLSPRRFHRLPWEDAPITAWVELHGTNLSLDLRQWKVLASDSSGRQFETGPGSSPFTNLVSFRISAFPRNEKDFKLRISPLFLNEQSPSTVEFKIRNPQIVIPPHWRARPLPFTNRVENLEVVLKSLEIPFETLLHSRIPYNSKVRFSLNTSLPALDWRLIDCEITDADGNRRGWQSLGSGRQPSVEMELALAQTDIWKVAATLSRTANFSSDELRIIHLGLAETKPLTNPTGRIFVSRLEGARFFVDADGAKDSRVLSRITAINESGKLADSPILVVDVRDSSGKLIDVPELFPSIMISGAGKVGWGWTLARSDSNITLQLAFPKVIKTEFYARPIVVR